jgi:hypothetical protein
VISRPCATEAGKICQMRSRGGAITHVGEIADAGMNGIGFAPGTACGRGKGAPRDPVDAGGTGLEPDMGRCISNEKWRTTCQVSVGPGPVHTRAMLGGDDRKTNGRVVRGSTGLGAGCGRRQISTGEV